MKKKIALILAVIMTIIAMGQSVSAINVIINSAFLEFPDQEPVIENGSTLVPIRPIAEALGLTVTWDNNTSTATLKKDSFFIELVIGSTVAKTSGGDKNLPIAPKIINGRTMVPLRFVAEVLGLTVSWNQEYQRVIITGAINTEAVTPTVENPVDDKTEEAVVWVDTPGEETEEPTQAESEIEDDTVFATVESESSTIYVEIPVEFYPDDFGAEGGFVHRTLNAFNMTFYMDYQKVSFKDCYVDENGTRGILFMTEELDAYEGEEYDVSEMNNEPPEMPEQPVFDVEPPEMPEIPENLDYEQFIIDYVMTVIRQICADKGVEMPEDIVDYDVEEILELFGMESTEELIEALLAAEETADFSQIEGYEEYLEYVEARNLYMEEYEAYMTELQEWYYSEYADWFNTDYAQWREEVERLNTIKHYATRKFSELYSRASDEAWAKLFDELFNEDENLRFDGVEIVDFDGKKMVHATVYAENPEDEQGVFELYLYPDGDKMIYIIGGTLLGSEPGDDIADALSRMKLK